MVIQLVFSVPVEVEERREFLVVGCLDVSRDDQLAVVLSLALTNDVVKRLPSHGVTPCHVGPVVCQRTDHHVGERRL